MEVAKILHFEKDDFSSQASEFFFKWGPRVLVAAIAGYYSLGIAYEWGIMASIDKIAIPILKNSVGYAGIGAVMPTFQWYSAWGVRTVSAFGAGLIYDVGERVVLYAYHNLQDKIYGVPPPSTSNAHSSSSGRTSGVRV